MESEYSEYIEYSELLELHAAYTAAVDAGDWDAWCELFIDDCRYRLQPRENYDRGLPLATLAFESKAMLQDRAYGIRETLFHDPYYQRHVVGPPLVRAREAGRVRTEASYAVFRTRLSEPTTVFNVGRYLDEIVRTPHGLRFATRLVIYDSELIPTSIIYPI
jgi:salicylate 5-hydroxylase small subunit